MTFNHPIPHTETPYQYIFLNAFKDGKEGEQLLNEMGEIPYEPLGIIYNEQNQ
jgi:hypothetical protein